MGQWCSKSPALIYLWPLACWIERRTNGFSTSTSCSETVLITRSFVESYYSHPLTCCNSMSQQIIISPLGNHFSSVQKRGAQLPTPFNRSLEKIVIESGDKDELLPYDHQQQQQPKWKVALSNLRWSLHVPLFPIQSHFSVPFNCVIKWLIERHMRLLMRAQDAPLSQFPGWTTHLPISQCVPNELFST